MNAIGILKVVHNASGPGKATMQLKPLKRSHSFEKLKLLTIVSFSNNAVHHISCIWENEKQVNGNSSHGNKVLAEQK